MPSDDPRPLARDYRDPHTRLGTNLTAHASKGASTFFVHECGFRHYENWNHRGILSPYWRLHHNFETGNAVRSDGIEYSLEPDTVTLVPGGVRIDTLGRKTVPHLWIHYVPAHEYLLALRQPVVISSEGPMKSMLITLREILDENVADPAQETRQTYHLTQALLHVAFSRLDPKLVRAFPERLTRLLEHIRLNLGNSLTSESLARTAGMSRHRLSDWFQKHLGHSPSRYVAEQRLRAAMQQLAATEDSIERIAEELGYPNRYYFSRVFKQQLGCGPATFRKGQRAENV